MRKETYEFRGNGLHGSQGFRRPLGDLADSAGRNIGREGRRAPPFCGIRTCAVSRGVEVCPFCEDYPCGKIAGLAKGYPTMLADGETMKAIGLEAWISEQEPRAATGFSLAGIRCHPYQITES